ncbi:MAG: hypothetical protein ABIP65_02125 [Vicinamibacterales bacterium]
MKLGFDLDGTVADLQGALALEARRLFPGVDPGLLPQSIAPDAAATTASEESGAPGFSMSSLSGRQQRELWDGACARVNFWETLEEIEPGSLARLSRLARDRRWEVIFLTSRPETRGDTAQVQSHRWLAAHGFDLPSVFVVHGSRGKIAASLQLDVLVDDRPENCLDIAMDSAARAILVWRGGEETVPGSARQLGIGSVNSIASCLDILESLDREDKDVGIVDRFKQLLGIKRPERRTHGKAPVTTRAAAARAESDTIVTTVG